MNVAVSSTVAVIVVVPTAKTVTAPVAASTVATSSFEEVYLGAASVALVSSGAVNSSPSLIV